MKNALDESDAMLAQRIRKRREDLGIEQKEFAARIGLGLSLTNRIELGKRRVEATHLPQIAAALECSVDALLLGGGDEQ